jgi:transposase
MLFPQSINEYIPQDGPLRAYDAFVDALDFEELGIEMDAHKVGCPQYDPKACSSCCFQNATQPVQEGAYAGISNIRNQIEK